MRAPMLEAGRRRRAARADRYPHRTDPSPSASTAASRSTARPEEVAARRGTGLPVSPRCPACRVARREERNARVLEALRSGDLRATRPISRRSSGSAPSASTRRRLLRLPAPDPPAVQAASGPAGLLPLLPRRPERPLSHQPPVLAEQRLSAQRQLRHETPLSQRDGRAVAGEGRRADSVAISAANSRSAMVRLSSAISTMRSISASLDHQRRREVHHVPDAGHQPSLQRQLAEAGA